MIARLLAQCLGNKYSIPRIVESLNKTSGSRLEENWYVFDHADEITEAITAELGVDLNRKYLRLGDIKNILGATKKPSILQQKIVMLKRPPRPYY
ncbi:MAG: hypothetical protein PHS83_06015 [Clostridia bacterium]|nr:hypothetical protein [Eubacteriales bacterium]MDD4146627.1 hypothetical protein [Clostridia bacterium]